MEELQILLEDMEVPKLRLNNLRKGYVYFDNNVILTGYRLPRFVFKKSIAPLGYSRAYELYLGKEFLGYVAVNNKRKWIAYIGNGMIRVNDSSSRWEAARKLLKWIIIVA